MNSTELELTKPEWAPLDNPAAFNMPPESIGYHLFTEYSDLLGGRLRPVTIFDQRPISLYLQGLRKEVEKHKLSTIGEVLRLPRDKFTLTFSYAFKRGLRDYVEGLAIPPHARLVNAVFGQDHHFALPFPPALEHEFTQTIEGLLDTLGPRRRDILTYRYGLADDITRTLKQTAAHPAFNVTRERIRQLEMNALRRLRHPSRAEHLEMFMPYPEGSLGRAIFGPRLRMYLPQMDDVQLPDPVASALLGYQVSVRRLQEKATPFHLENIRHIAVWLDHGLNNPQTPAPDTTEQKTEQKQWTNNLIPELPISSEQLTAIGRINLSEVGFPNVIRHMFKRYNAKTFGDVLTMTPLEFAGLRTLGKIRAFQIGMKLGELLQLPEDKYPGDYVAKLLENIVINLKAPAVKAREAKYNW